MTKRKTYRDYLSDTLKEGVPDWARELLAKLPSEAPVNRHMQEFGGSE